MLQLLGSVQPTTALANAAGGNSNGSAVAAPTLPRSAAEAVWGIAPDEEADAAPEQQPRMLVLSRPPGLGQQLQCEAAAMDASALTPGNLEAPAARAAFNQLLSQHLLSKRAKQQGVLCVVLSAPYLPSQLAWAAKLASGMGLVATPLQGGSRGSTAGEAGVHLMFFREAHDGEEAWHTALQPGGALAEALGGGVEPLPAARLAVAAAAEQALVRRLALWESDVWSRTLQARLLARRTMQAYVAAPCLMGRTQLDAARALVHRLGPGYLRLALVPLEHLAARAGLLEPGEVQPAAGEQVVIISGAGFAVDEQALGAQAAAELLAAACTGAAPRRDAVAAALAASAGCGLAAFVEHLAGGSA